MLRSKNGAQSSFEDGDNRRDLLLHALVRFVETEQALLERRRAVQGCHTVVSKRLLQRMDERRGKPFTLRLQHSQVRKQINLGAWFFAAGPMVDLRVAPEQGTYVYKNV